MLVQSHRSWVSRGSSPGLQDTYGLSVYGEAARKLNLLFVGEGYMLLREDYHYWQTT